MILPLISTLAVTSSVCLYLSGGKTCLDINKKKNTGSIALFPFVATFVNSVVWLKYGLLNSNYQMITVNVIGSSLQVVYIAIYYLHTIDKRKAQRLISTSLLAVILILVNTKYLEVTDEDAQRHLGLLGTFLALVMIASPFVSLVDVISTKSTESMSFPFISICFLSCIFWTMLGYLYKDMFIIIPNGIGIFFGGIQLSFFVFYPSNLQSVNKSLEGTESLIA